MAADGSLPARATLPPGATARQLRGTTFARGTLDPDKRTVELALSSEEPVDRPRGIEILGHRAGEIDSDFIGSGRAPLLLDHDPKSVIGVVESIALGADRKLRARVRFGRGETAERAMQDVADGIRANVSVGYELLQVDLVKEDKGGNRTFRATRWRPLEASLVGIPADMTVGVGRGAGQPSQHLSGEHPTMDNITHDAAPPDGAEATRRREIMAIAELCNMREFGVKGVLEGDSIELFRGKLMLAREGQPKPLGPVGGGPFSFGDDRLAAPRVLRGFRLFAGRAGKGGEGVPVPDNFAGHIVRAHDGTHVPILARGDKLASFIPDDDDAKYARELGLAGFCRALLNGAKTALEERVLGGAAVGTGGAMLPTPLALGLIDRLRAQTVVMEFGAQTIPMLSGTLRFARVTADPAGSWRAENSAINDSDPVFDNLTLTKRSWGVLTRYSRELMYDAPNVEAAITDMFARVAAVAVDQAALVGTGTGNQPTGIANTAGIQSIAMGTNGAQMTNWTRVLDAVQLLEAANAGNITGMAMAPRTARTIYGFADTTGQPLAPPPRLAGIAQRGTTSMPVNETQGTANNASSIVLGDFTEVMLGFGPEIEITIHPDRYADLGQVALIGFVRADVQVQRPSALARVQGITP